MTGGLSGPEPEDGRYRAFYGQPEPVEFEVVLPDDIDGEADLRQFLIDAAPFSRQAAVRVEPAFPPGGAVPGATNLPESSQSAARSGNDGSGDLRARLAGLVRQPFDGVVSTPTAAYANAVADAVLADGFRRVVEDDDTIERAAGVRALKAALECSRGHARGARAQDLDRETCRFLSGVSGFLRSRIRALEAGEEPDWPDAANSVRADLGSCVRCGVRDAADGEQLCGRCDGELEAEVAQGRAVRALREETWVPGDPVHPRETGLTRCDGCGTQWTDGPAACPECGKVPNG